jgi:hypothetical protein
MHKGVISTRVQCFHIYCLHKVRIWSFIHYKLLDIYFKCTLMEHHIKTNLILSHSEVNINFLTQMCSEVMIKGKAIPVTGRGGP